MAKKKSTLLQKWMAISQKGAAVLLLVLLYVFYFTLLVPIALVYLFVSDPLRRKLSDAQNKETFFVAKAPVNDSLAAAHEPF